ncbi:hypothetical protein JHK87_019643 [Glycine soja]|nr:hypothetical protein JHK87_019643 [Glycine soja]
MVNDKEISTSDLCNVKQCCEEFLDAAEDDHVYQQASLEKFALAPLAWFTSDSESLFLKRCKETGNTEIVYREAMVEYFTSSRVESGLENLKKVAMEGHDEEKSACFFMCSEDEGEKKQGFDIFCSFKASTSIIMKCRNRVKAFVQSMWVNNKAVIRNRKTSFCPSVTCNSERLNKLSRWTSSSEDEEAGSNAISCECCRVDYELGLFCNIFGV